MEHCKVDIPRVQFLKDAENKLNDILQNFNDIISKCSGDIGTIPLISMDIDTGDSPPISQRPYTFLLKHHKWVKIEIQTLESAGVIRKSFSPWQAQSL